MVASGDQIVLEPLLIYYISIAYERNLSKRELREKIKNKEYERLPIIKDAKVEKKHFRKV